MRAALFWLWHYAREHHFERCKFCVCIIHGEGYGSAICERCWYGQRLEPEEWRAWLRSIGRPPPIFRGGSIAYVNDLGHACIGSRDPFAPGLALVGGHSPESTR